MINNDSNNQQWWMAWIKKNHIGLMRDSKKQSDHNGTYSNEGERVIIMQSMKPGGRKVPTGNINKAGTASGWTKVNGKRHVKGDNPKNAEDGMAH
jgi:hypothetical protein